MSGSPVVGEPEVRRHRVLAIATLWPITASELASTIE